MSRRRRRPAIAPPGNPSRFFLSHFVTIRDNQTRFFCFAFVAKRDTLGLSKQQRNFDMNVKVKALSKAEIAAMFDKPKMSDGEKAARLYLGNKQTQRAIKTDRNILVAYALFSLGALASPFIIFWGI